MKEKSRSGIFKLKRSMAVLVILLAVTELFISHRLATAGEAVRELEKRAESLEKENQIIKEEVALSGSLIGLPARAEKLGLIKADRIVSYTSEIPVALNSLR